MGDKLRNYLVERRRYLLGEVKYIDRVLEDWEEEKRVKDIPVINPHECDHEFKEGSCFKCGIFEHIAKKSDMESEDDSAIIKEADKPEK